MLLKSDLRHWHSVWWYNPSFRPSLPLITTMNSGQNTKTTTWVCKWGCLVESKFGEFTRMEQVSYFSCSHPLQAEHGTAHKSQVKLCWKHHLLSGYSRRKRMLDNHGQLPGSEGDSHRREREWDDSVYEHHLSFIHDLCMCGLASKYCSKALNNTVMIWATTQRVWDGANSLTLKRESTS